MVITTDYRKSYQMLYYLLLTSLISAFNEIPAASTVTAHYIIPNEWTNSSNCSDCHTFSEWIESGTSPFTSDTTVVLLPGLHLINTTINWYLIENINSLVLTGQQGEATVECLHEFGFEFRNIKNITVSHVQFRSCDLKNILFVNFPVIINSTLLLLNCRNISILNVNITNGGITVAVNVYREQKFKFQFKTISVVRSHFQIYDATRAYNLFDGMFPIDMYVSNCMFQGSNIKFSIPSSKGSLELRMILVEQMKGFLPAMQVYKLSNVSLTNVTFRNNSSPLIHMTDVNTVTINGHCYFNFNHGESGIFIHTNALNVSHDTELEMNSNNVEKFLFRISLYGEKQVSIWLYSVIRVHNNTVEKGAIVELSSNSMEFYHLYANFDSNYGFETDNTAIMLILDTNITLVNTSLAFSHNKAKISGGITFVNSHLSVVSVFIANFNNNEGRDGGAMSFYKKSSASLSAYHVCVKFSYNRAQKRGGAIFVEDSDYINSLTGAMEVYFIRTHEVQANYLPRIQFLFSNNSAEIAGDDVYGGWIDLCKFLYIVVRDNVILVNMGVMWVFAQNDLHSVTSNPIRICICFNSIPLCNVTEYKVNTLFPGQTFEIEAVAVGQRMGIVPSIVLAQFDDEEGRLGEGQDVQSVGRRCTNLHFTVFTSKHYKVLGLRTQDMGVPQLMRDETLIPHESHLKEYQYLFQQFSVLIRITNCNLGFVFHENLESCQCSPLIVHHDGVECDLSTWSIKRTEGKWLLATNEHSNFIPHTRITIHDHCPYDYCRTDTDSLTFHLEIPDDQCSFNRSGVLCGECQANFSQVFGTSKCRECSNIMLLAVIPATIFLGIVLVALLMILDLTISTGTINGLIFYANIIRASQAIFFPPETNSSFLSIFIAWLNLDLGIETCFYDGLDAYAKTWLQFVFPLYIWLMVITIIVASHYSSTASKLFGNNAVQVLATLFLFSYAKILRVAITVFSFTVLVYPDGYKKKIWLLDGNIEFLCGQHIPLFIASLLMFLLLSIPYTFSLLSIQWLQRNSDRSVLLWVHRLMPLFDAHTGPYKHKHRYWTGLLLVVRVLFILIFSLNISNNPAVNLLAIAVTSFTIFGYLCYMRVYKKLLHNILEALLLFNLGLVSVATLYQISNEGCRIVSTYLSISVSFVIFICVTLYHALQRLLSLRRIKLIWSHISTFVCRITNLVKRDGSEEHVVNQQLSLNVITHSSVELAQPLIIQESLKTTIQESLKTTAKNDK